MRLTAYSPEGEKFRTIVDNYDGLLPVSGAPRRPVDPVNKDTFTRIMRSPQHVMCSELWAYPRVQEPNLAGSHPENQMGITNAGTLSEKINLLVLTRLRTGLMRIA